MITRILHSSTVLSLISMCGILCVGEAQGRSFQAPTNNTGAPGHSTCATCHTSNGNGSVNLTFSGGSQYIPGELYSIMVTVEDSGQERFGFSMVSRDTDKNTVDVGAWSAGSADTTTNGLGNNHASHLNAPFDTDSHTFEVNWTAPEPGVGEVTFYVAGNAANGNLSNGPGDNVYTNTLIIGESMPNQAPLFSIANTTLNATSGIPAAVEGIALDDPDAADGDLTVALSVQNGSLTISDVVAGGVGSGDISNNGTASVTLEGTLAELNATFGDAQGVTYQSDPGFVGSETLTLMANDNGNTGPGGEQTDSAEIMIAVNPLPKLSDFAFVDDGVFEFTLTGAAGLTYVVEASLDLQTWEMLEETTLVTESATVTDSGASVPSKFYRARESGP